MSPRQRSFELPKTRSLKDALFPVGSENELVPSLFLAESGPREIQRPGFLARDGRLLLDTFFKLVPAPRDNQEGITIHRRFRSLVPDEWRESTQYYRYLHLPLTPVSACRWLLVCGEFFPRISNPGLIRRQLQALRKAIGLAPGLEAQPRFLFLFAESDEPAAGLENESISAYFDAFGDDSEPMSWNEFYARSDFTNCAFVELTPWDLCADSFLTQRLLARGATPLLPGFQGLGEATMEPSANSVLLSAYHGLELTSESSPVVSDWACSIPAVQAIEFCRALAHPAQEDA